MAKRTKAMVGAAILAAVVAGGAGIGMAVDGGDDSEPPIIGLALERATAAALDHTGGGRVTDTEVGDEEGFYEVEVTLDGGRQVDVHLDEQFRVLGSEGDSDRVEDEDEDED
ncbi:MAG TPA: hypothetical protein VM618_06550 [Acidimicrobiia bacterium]|nr:hypothetical protein [Acidimicrobiia bacterium]